MEKKVAIFCAGYLFDVYYTTLIKKYEISYVIDNNPQKWGHLFQGCTCLSFEEAIKNNVRKIIIATKNKNIIKDIKEQIENSHVELEVLFLKDLIQNEIELKDSKYQECYEDNLNNKIFIEKGVVFNKINICFQGTDNIVTIGRNTKVESYIYAHFMGDGNTLQIGENTFIGSAYIILAESGNVSIGNDCMISSDVDIFQGTSHPIFDKNTYKRINYSKDIIIGDSVWIGKRAALMSGFSIGDGSIVGYGSVSSGSFGNNLIIAGCPAKVTKTNIVWKKDYVGLYALDRIDDAKE